MSTLIIMRTGADIDSAYSMPGIVLYAVHA